MKIIEEVGAYLSLTKKRNKRFSDYPKNALFI